MCSEDSWTYLRHDAGMNTQAQASGQRSRFGSEGQISSMLVRKMLSNLSTNQTQWVAFITCHLYICIDDVTVVIWQSNATRTSHKTVNSHKLTHTHICIHTNKQNINAKHTHTHKIYGSTHTDERETDSLQSRSSIKKDNKHEKWSVLLKGEQFNNNCSHVIRGLWCQTLPFINSTAPVQFLCRALAFISWKWVELYTTLPPIWFPAPRLIFASNSAHDLVW